MKRMRIIAAALTLMCGVVCGNLCAIDLSVIRDGGIMFEGGDTSVVAYRPGWNGIFGPCVTLWTFQKARLATSTARRIRLP